MAKKNDCAFADYYSLREVNVYTFVEENKVCTHVIMLATR